MWCVVEYTRQLEVRRATSLTRVVLVFGCGLKRNLVVVVCVVGLVFLFFDAPFSLLAVFNHASAFNSDVSSWNTGAVTTMERSKCALSLSLSVGHGTFRCGVVLNIYDNSRFVGSQISHVFVLFFVCGLKRDLLLLFVWWVWSFFSLLHPSLFLQCFIRHLCSTTTCPTGILGR